jgi:hypothetical protein
LSSQDKALLNNEFREDFIKRFKAPCRINKSGNEARHEKRQSNSIKERLKSVEKQRLIKLANFEAKN